MLSMGKFEEPNSGTSSFSMLLGDAPFLDGRYTVFGRVVSGDEVLSRLETVETKKEGIFVMPKDRIEILSAVVMTASSNGALEPEHGAAPAEERARAVKDYLVARRVPEDRLTAVGFGSKKPIDPRDSLEAYRKNRRVEFIVRNP